MGGQDSAKRGRKSNENELTMQNSSTTNSSGNNTADTTPSSRHSGRNEEGGGNDKKGPQILQVMAKSKPTTTTVASFVPQQSRGVGKSAANMPLQFPKSGSLPNMQNVMTKSTNSNAGRMTPASESGKGVNTGNDRVTIDKSKQPLVPLRVPPPSQTTTAKGKLIAKDVASTVKTIPAAAVSSTLSEKDKSTTTIPSSVPIPTPIEAKNSTPTPLLPQVVKQTNGNKNNNNNNNAITKGDVGGKANTTTAKDNKPKTSSSLAAAVALNTSVSVPAAPPVLDEEAIIEEAIRKARAPLADPYSPYIIPSDKSLTEARCRLKTAIEQTRKLRSAFTERVYGKYRVCLQPPPSSEQIFERIMADPTGTSKRLNDAIKQCKSEKEAEKKEAQKLNAELNAMNNAEGEDASAAAVAAMNAETAEQLLFVSAGLSLIILPEHDTSKFDLSCYPDRAPLNPETGQRVRSISAAAAAAGEVMLDRARKGAAMRAERRRRRQRQLNAGEDPEKDDDSNYSRLSLLSKTSSPMMPQLLKSMTSPPISKNVSSTSQGLSTKSSSPTPGGATKSAPASTPSITPKTFKRLAPKTPNSTPSPGLSAKAIRARVQATMSNNTLLSLNPSAEELRTDGKASATTLALLDQGVGAPGSNSKAVQQRFRHPFPNSIGARRRAFGPGAMKKVGGTDPLLHLSLALPPLPSAKERRLRKPLPVLDTSEVSTSRANTAIRGILDHFVVGRANCEEDLEEYQRPRKRRLTEISFLHALEYSKDKRKGAESTSLSTEQNGKPKVQKGPIDPMLTFNVLKAVGLIKPTLSDAVSSKSINSILDPSLIEVAEKNALGEEGGQSYRSISKLKELTNKFSSRKRTLTDAFFTLPSKISVGDVIDAKPIGKDGAENLSSAKEDPGRGDIKVDTTEKMTASIQPPVLSIRGGGQVLQDSNDSTRAKSQVPGSLNVSQAMEPKPINPLSNVSKIHLSPGSVQHSPGSPSRPLDMQAMAGNPAHAADMSAHRMIPQPLVLINPQQLRAEQGYRLTPQSSIVQHGNNPTNAPRDGRVQGQMRHHPAANAIQLAHQLRPALASMQRVPNHGQGDLEAYIGGLHSQQAAAGWSQMNAHNSLAALALNPHRAMVNFSVQDRARVILREQQTAAAAAAHAAAAQRQQQAVALMGGTVGHGYGSGGAPHFPRVPGHGGSIVNPAPGMMGHSGMQQVPEPTSVATPVLVSVQPPKQDGKSANALPSKQDAKVDQPIKPSKDSKDSALKKDQNESNSGIANLEREKSKPQDSSSRKRKMSSDSAQSEKRRNVANSNAAKSGKPPVSSAKTNEDAKNSQPTGKISSIDASKMVAKSKIQNKAISKGGVQKKGKGTETLRSNEAFPVINPSVDNGKPKKTSGMQFYVPPAPPGIPSDIASMVLKARTFEAIKAWECGESVFDAGVLVEYLLSVGSAVPIPKVLVASPLKDKMSANSLKNNSFGNIPATSREVIVGAILLWLWRHHEDCFQKAFAKSGRIDVDPECKWLINAAVERAVLVLSQEIATPGSHLSSSLAVPKTKGGSSSKSLQGSESERSQAKNTKVDLLTLSIVSKSLAEGMAVDEQMVRVICNFVIFRNDSSSKANFILFLLLLPGCGAPELSRHASIS